MRCRIRDIFVHGIVEDQRKKFFDAIYQIEAERIKRANKGLYEYKWRMDLGRIDLQAREAEHNKKEENWRAQTVESSAWEYKRIMPNPSK